MNAELKARTWCCVCGCVLFVPTRENTSEVKCEDCKDEAVEPKEQ